MTDSTMLERVARAIASGLGDDFDHSFVGKSDWVAARGEKGGRFRDVNEPRQSDYLEAARAAMEAMRSPDRNLVRRAVGYTDFLLPDETHDNTPDGWEREFTMAWNCLIDTALSPLNTQEKET